MKGRIPEPTALKVIKGVRPGRINKEEPRPTIADGAIPRGWGGAMTPIAKRFWKRHAPGLIELGVLTEADLESFRVLAELYAEWVGIKTLLAKGGISYEDAKGVRHTRPEMTVKDKLEKQMLAYFQHFGMTPASRSKIATIKPKEKMEDPLQKLWNERHSS